MILIEDIIRETVTTRKISQGYSLTHQKNESQQKMSRPLQQKVDYGFDTDEKNSNTNESQSENENLLIKWDKEQEYKEYDECK